MRAISLVYFLTAFGLDSHPFAMMPRFANSAALLFIIVRLIFRIGVVPEHLAALMTENSGALD